MKYSNAIVTMAIGDQYLELWKEVAEANWRQYAANHGYDIICIEKPLDTSERARQRSPAWQKCLILSQDFAQHYERVVWIDADILINTASAPSVVAGVPIDKVGAVEATSGPTRQLYLEALKREYEFWGSNAIINYSAQDYYTSYGFPNGYDEVVQSGVVVLSPRHHRELLERVYFDYEEKGGREWHMEMRPLSYELLKADAVHWIDYRFNVNWFEQMILHYPFLVNLDSSSGLNFCIKRKVAAFLEGSSMLSIRKACATAIFLSSFFLHFGGGSTDMTLVDLAASLWHDCRL